MTTTPKTATITLRAGDNTMRLSVVRRPDGAATSFVSTTDGNKQTTRGMTRQHSTFDEAKAAITALAAEAEKLGWNRTTGGRGFVAKPDAFTALPPAPKSAKTAGARR